MAQPPTNTKYILSLAVARYLLAQGFQLIDIEPARKFDGLTFIFEDTPVLRTEMVKFAQSRKKER